MKKIVKTAVIVFIAAMLLTLSACGGAPSKTQEKSLYDHGMELISLLDEMAGSEEYLTLYSASGEINDIVAGAAAGDFSQPKAVYKLTGGADSALDLTDEAAAFDAMSDTLQELVKSRMFAALMTQINASAGAKTLAASSICTAGKTFVSTELTENMSYIYVFENAVPVAVTFTMGEDSAVSASATFLLYDSFTGSIEEVAQFLNGIGLKIEEIELK